MKLEEIGFYTLDDVRAKISNQNSPLWRCELILTDKCNPSCIYCKGLHDKNKGIVSFNNARNIVIMWADDGLKNIRFSGGETTTWLGLPMLSYIARKHGIRRVSVSTDGSADLDFYKSLVSLGVTDFSISLDACLSSINNTIVGKDTWKKLTENIKKIARLTYTTIGIVLTKKNIKDIEKIISFISNVLEIDDIRIVPSYKKSALEKISINNDILGRHPILKYRVDRSSFKRVRGLTDTDFNRCPLVLDDMIIAKEYHYPCNIYLREQGNPVGTIKDFNIEKIRNQRYYWYMNHNTYKDPICKNNCLDIFVDYNNKWFDFHKGEATKVSNIY